MLSCFVYLPSAFVDDRERYLKAHLLGKPGKFRGPGGWAPRRRLLRERSRCARDWPRRDDVVGGGVDDAASFVLLGGGAFRRRPKGPPIRHT